MKTRSPRHETAFSLIEVTLALGIVAVCLIPLFGMLPIGIKNDAAAVQQTAANGILSAVASDLRAVSHTSPAGGATTTAQYGIPIPAKASEAGTAPYKMYFSASGTEVSTTPTTTGADPSRYTVTVQILSNVSNPPAPAAGNVEATFATVLVSWPALTTSTIASGSVQTFVALNRN